MVHIDSDGRLHLADGSSFDIARNPERWRTWLELGQSFRLMGLSPEGYTYVALTVRLKQASRGGPAWHAYRYIERRQRQVYLGKSESVTLERLREAAQQLT